MIHILEDTEKARDIFAGWEETLIWSCLQKVMGRIYVTDTVKPLSARAQVGCFCFCAGVPDEQLIHDKPNGFIIMVPQNDDWARLTEKCFPDAVKCTRYAIRKDTGFDRERLEHFVSLLPDGCELKAIDGDLYDRCLESPVTADFVAAFEGKENYLKLGKGYVIIKDGRIVSGASSFSRYRDGIEIEVDTEASERRKGLATIVCARLILECLKEGLYPSWDAQNMNSVHLAEKLGYEFSHSYTAYEITTTEAEL